MFLLLLFIIITVQFFVQCRATNKKRLLDRILTEFRTFLLEHLKSYTSELSDLSLRRLLPTPSAHYPSLNSLKSRASSNFPNLETKGINMFNLEVLNHLENVSKALLVQDSAKASLLLSDSIKLLKVRNRKIRFADSSEGGWLTVKHYESNAATLDLEDDKRIRAAEREAKRIKTRTRAKRQNAERVQGRHPPLSQPYNLRGHFQRSQFASSTAAMYQQPRDSYNRQRGTCRFFGSSRHWWRECPVRLA